MHNQVQNEFDNTPTHWNSDSRRWNVYPQHTLPLWIADMDFAIADPIRRALADRINTKPLWYAKIDVAHNQAICEYLQLKYNWIVAPESIVWLPGVMTGIYQSISLLPTDAQVIVPQPVYPPLTTAAQLRKAYKIPMIQTTATNKEPTWQWTLPLHLPKKTKALLLCHPHNPTGKVFDKHELITIGEYAHKHGLLVLSDEIHADLTLDTTHIPFGSVCPEHKKHTMTYMSAGKAFNIAGLQCAFAIIENTTLHKALQARLQLCGAVNFLGVIATLAAYAHGGYWQDNILSYLRDNRTILDNWITTNSKVNWIANQATHLAWIHINQHSNASMHEKLLASGLALSPGNTFGGAQYVRLNYATSKTRLQEALRRFSSALTLS